MKNFSIRAPSSRQKFFLSIALGMAAASTVWLYLDRAERRINRRYEMTTVLQTRRFVARDKALTPEAVDEVSVPVGYVQPTALHGKRELTDAAGRFYLKARVGLQKGEQVMRSTLYDDNAKLGLAWALPAGQTALTLRLNPEQAVAGLLQPGDMVHVLAAGGRGAGVSPARLLLRRVLVVGVQDDIWDPSVSVAEKAAPKNMANEAILVTLSLTPFDALRLASAVDGEKITLILIAPLETQS